MEVFLRALNVLAWRSPATVEASSSANKNRQPEGCPDHSFGFIRVNPR
jgi:hypothetical protein